MKHLEKCEQVVQTWPKWKVESIRAALGIPKFNEKLSVGSKVHVDFVSESSTEFSMDAYKYKKEVDCFLIVFFSKTLRNFYAPIIISIIFFMWRVVCLI